MTKVASNIASMIEKIILYLLGFLFFCMISLFALLQYGIKIETIAFMDNRIEGLYLKLDKKLILHIHGLDIKTSLKQEAAAHDDSIKQTADIAQNIKLLLDYFQEIDIGAIKYEGYEGSLKFNGTDLLLDTDDLSVAANFHVEKDLIILNVASLVAKGYKVNTFGTLVYDLRKKKVNYGGDFIISPDIIGTIAIDSDLKSAQIDLTSQVFSSIAPLKQFIPLASKDAREWTFDKVQPKRVKLNRCTIAIDDLNQPETIGKNDIFVDFIIEDADIKFQPQLPAAKTTRVTGMLKNNDFLFTVYGGRYQNIKLNNAKVLIGDIFTDGRSALYLDIDTKAPLNQSIADILKSYKVNMPVLQTKGMTDAKFKLSMPFSTLEPSVEGTFKAKDSAFTIGSFAFLTNSADVTLRNTELDIKNSSFIIPDLLDSNISGHMDVKNGIFKSSTNVRNFTIQTGKEKIISIKDKQIESVLDFSDGSDISLNVPQFQTLLHFKEDGNAIFVDNLALMYPHSKLLQDFGVEGGKITVFTKNFEDFNIEGSLTSEKIPLLEDGKPIKTIELTSTITREETIINGREERFKVVIQKLPTVYINGLDINISQKLLEGEPKGENADKNIAAFPTFKLYAKKSNIFFKERKFLTDRFSVDSSSDGMNISFQYKTGQGSIRLAKDTIDIGAEGLNDQFVNTAAKREFADGGIFTLKAETKKGGLDGNFSFKGTTLKNLKSLNNMLAFFDTIPALVTFKNPGFNEEGYQVDHGSITFTLTDADMLLLKQIYIDGITMDINGSGYLNLKNDTLNIPLQVTTMKALSSIIDAIPIVNYILLGKDGSINVGVEVNGTIDDPQVHTTTLEDVAASPFRIIRRILETPFRIFE